MKELIDAHGGVASLVLLVMVSVNIILTAVKALIEKWQPSPEQQANSKVDQIVTKILGFTSGIIDWLTGNKEHK